MTNVLVLLSDQHNADFLGCAGHPLAQTPTLDRLAAEGTRFTRAYTPSPICVPARAALATGRWVHQIGCWDNALAYAGRPEGWAHRLRAAGRRAESIGKLHFKDAEIDAGFSAQHLPTHIHEGVGQVWGSVRDPLPDRNPSTLFTDAGPGLSSYNRYDMAVAERAEAWLRDVAAQSASEPWVLFVGFVAPHHPLIVPEPYLERFPPDAMPTPRLRPQDGHAQHPWAAAHNQMMDHEAAFADDGARRMAIASYLGLCAFLDDQIASVLAALEASGQAGDTLVIYASDHGECLGVRGFWGKCNLYRESTAVPLILRGPGVPAGRAASSNVSLLDLAPTIAAAAGVAPDPAWPGADLRPLAAQDDPGRLAFSEYHAVGSPSAGFMIADDRWKLHHYVGYRPELFDLRTDPGETRDRADDPACADVLSALRRALEERLGESPDAVDQRAKADQAALIARFGGREAALGQGAPGATPITALDAGDDAAARS